MKNLLTWLRDKWYRVRYWRMRRKFINAVNYVPTVGNPRVKVVLASDAPPTKAPLTPEERQWRVSFSAAMRQQNEELRQVREEFNQKNVNT